MKNLPLKQITDKIKSIKFPKFDLIVAIGKDGIMPASLLKHFLKLPVEVIWINYRNKANKPIRKTPILKKPLKNKIKNLKNKKILLVDTVSRTGKTLEKAKELLLLNSKNSKGLENSKNFQNKNNQIKTFVINGKADYSLFNFKECIEWPW